MFMLFFNECDVLLLPMYRKKKAQQIIFATFLDFQGNLASYIEKLLETSVCKLKCKKILILKILGFLMWI